MTKEILIMFGGIAVTAPVISMIENMFELYETDGLFQSIYKLGTKIFGLMTVCFLALALVFKDVRILLPCLIPFAGICLAMAITYFSFRKKVKKLANSILESDLFTIPDLTVKKEWFLGREWWTLMNYSNGLMTRFKFEPEIAEGKDDQIKVIAMKGFECEQIGTLIPAGKKTYEFRTLVDETEYVFGINVSDQGRKITVSMGEEEIAEACARNGNRAVYEITLSKEVNDNE